MKILLHENRQRIQGICLEDIHDEDEAVIIDALSGDTEEGSTFFPVLEELAISLHDKIYGYRNANSPFRLPNEMLQALAPDLKKLHLQYCAIAEESGIFHNISHLSIRENSGCSFAAPFLCRALVDMPNLESLELTLFGNSELVTSVNFGTQLATLSKLYHVKIHGWPIELVISFLQMISIGPQRTVWITGVEAKQPEQILRLFTCIISHTLGSSSTHRLTLRLTEMEVVVSASRGSQTLRDDIFLRVDIPWLLRNRFDPHPLVDGILRRMNYQDLQILRLGCSPPLSTQSWVKFFGKLSSLDSIIIPSGGLQLFAALVDRSEYTPVETNVSVALPFQALRKVEVDVGRDYTNQEMDCILKCLRKRMDLGKTLKLSFMNCSDMLVSQIDAFRGVVTQMETHCPESNFKLRDWPPK
jgi:hypothetical protein